ncbi:MAG: Rhamnolipids biosynthesis 3-oxoacyl-[acyl-carrier-protein] reductase [Alphaproteobacteria bacterium MarineAlpha5_Bin6]|nr:MAG: Rhamnolipids biosynthesis 3-oxoacyl-[acyl-carrier-protein] reductase [Alphaproteobacteria bacterium MarineAlpha5_Bin6]|tara:strand:- start:5026 stop:5790 length:765 start_codon:yes stop_codon:yes gene_type:complete
MKKKNIIITGASSGLGELIAKELSKDGHKLFLISRDEKKLKNVIYNCHNTKIHNFAAIDFQDLKNIELTLKKTSKLFSKIDIIIHVAGGGLGVKNYLPKTEDYLKVFNLNLFSIFELNRLLVPRLIKRKAGTIINIGSIASNEAVGALSYNVAKSSLSSYVRTLSKYLAKYNVCVTGISPGAFIYKQNAMARLKKNNIKAYNNFIKKRIPSNRMPNAIELLPLIKMLCEKDNMMLTGNMISCDAGEGNFYKSYY